MNSYANYSREQLLKKITALEREKTDLEKLLLIHEPLPDIFVEVGHNDRVSKIIRLLLARPIVSADMICKMLSYKGYNQPSYAGVYISYARKALELMDIKLLTIWNKGWYIRPSDKDKLRRAVDESNDRRRTEGRV